jgi:hypothetical protein
MHELDRQEAAEEGAVLLVSPGRLVVFIETSRPNGIHGQNSE